MTMTTVSTLAPSVLASPTKRPKVEPMGDKSNTVSSLPVSASSSAMKRKAELPEPEDVKLNGAPALKRPKSESPPAYESPSYENPSCEKPSCVLRIKKLSDKARTPKRGSPLAAGYDLYSAEETVIPAREKALIDTQISIALPEGTYGRVAPRSGLASKFMIDTGAGVIDADYRGVIKVLLFNLSGDDFTVKEGDRIAQLIIEKIETPTVLEVEELDDTKRGSGGFGSTGGHDAL